MALFLSTVTNKVDSKGRVSVPSSFRASLSDQAFQGVVLFCSQNHDALEGFPLSYMEEISKRMDHYDLFSKEQDDLATTIFAQSVQLSLDGDGRIIIPEALLQHAKLSDKATFIGMGHKFQIWDSKLLETRKNDALKSVQSKNLTIPKRKEHDDG